MFMATAVVIFLGTVIASQASQILEGLNPGKADRLEDVSFEMLQEYNFVLLTGQNAFLTSRICFGTDSLELLALADNSTEPVDALEDFFAHVEFLPDQVNSYESEPVNVQGCFDNTYSSTTSLVAKTYGTTSVNVTGPRAFVQILGTLLGVLMKRIKDESREEKLTCAVGPGERLQLQMSTIRTKVFLTRQRMLRFEDGVLSDVDLSPWQDLDDLDALEFSSEVVMCVTDEKYLLC